MIRVENFTGAVAVFSKIIEESPKFAVAFFLRCSAKVSLKDYNGGINDYSQAVEIDPKYADAFYYRGNAKYFSTLH